jgi:phenylpyruvate tautomerase PptA (4-oxalocrotonate tautomerase family)
MPMIDVFAPANMFPDDADRAIGEELTLAVLRAEGVQHPVPFQLDNTAAFIHRMPASAVQTAASADARVVRVQVVTPPGALSREGQRTLVKEATEIVARHATDNEQGKRTWVVLTEAAEGGWGIAGTAFGKEEFGALAARAKAAQAG